MRRHRHKIFLQFGDKQSRLAQWASGNFPDGPVVIGVNLVIDIDEPLATGHVNPLTRWIVDHVVDAGRDRESLQHLSGVGI